MPPSNRRPPSDLKNEINAQAFIRGFTELKLLMKNPKKNQTFCKFAGWHQISILKSEQSSHCPFVIFYCWKTHSCIIKYSPKVYKKYVLNKLSAIVYQALTSILRVLWPTKTTLKMVYL